MKELNEVIRRYKEESKALSDQDREFLIMEYSPLIKHIAQKIALRLPSNIELDDLISAGVIGLMDAIEKFDHTRDNQFKTYAEFRIRGAILDELRSQDWVPRSVREKAKVIERTISRLESETGVMPTEEDVARELNVSVDEYWEMLNEVRSVSLLSIDELVSISGGERKSLLGLVDGYKVANPLKQLSLKDLQERLVTSIKDLPEKHRLVLSLYYYEDLNLKEIGKVLEVTESRVSQLHTEAILRLRSKLKGYYEDIA
jgi:RNA polymerase sigma factor for flagellar operon FliA